jgi:hypothetical protein
MDRLELALALVVFFGSVCEGAPPSSMEFTLLDDFREPSAWLQGDPKISLQERDFAVITSKEFVKAGKQSLLFTVHVNWTPRPGEKYPLGWPTIGRSFATPQDWSRYDYLCFRLLTKSSRRYLPDPALKIGFSTRDGKGVEKWHAIPGIRTDQWQEIAVPLAANIDRVHITGIRLYVAEAWYEDRDRVDFYLSDMRLGKRTLPGLLGCTVCSRTGPRGEGLRVGVRAEGPISGTSVRCRITDLKGSAERTFTEPLTTKDQNFAWQTRDLPPGGHHAEVDLLAADGRSVDSCRKYFRSLQAGKRCYLKLVTFYTPPVGKCDPKQLAVLNDSAYAGVAIPPVPIDESAAPVPDCRTIEPQLAAVRQALTIDPWPWVDLNRFIGARPDSLAHEGNNAGALKYFTAIKGMDLDNETGARGDMLNKWRLALRTARRWKSPGVMWDPEAYNDYRAYDVRWVAKARGETMDQVIRKCEKLGGEMARIVAAEYPTCIVWSLFSRLEEPTIVPGREQPIFTTPAHITLGLLRYAKEHRVPLKYLCGGETTPGYCSKSLAELKQKIADRDEAMAPFLEEFPDHLFLAGTISPFHDYRLASGWIKEGKYAGSPFKTLADFQPMFKALFDAYDWVWIYASSAAKTEPYNPKNNRMYSSVLRAALDASAKGGGP